MGCAHNLICGHRHHHFAISFLILVISTSSQLRIFNAEGRKLAQTAFNSTSAKEDKSIWRAQIGSRPPRCERRCGSCAHCEAIQVPTNPQIRSGIENSARGDDNSNYKPMSWKCKCGNLIFNP
ncbi:hypothetical protein Pfo_008546 [Paulownia fortunei]|nr:hypothetical protein Pfo_008546 [Paulownia fortunei]